MSLNKPCSSHFLLHNQASVACAWRSGNSSDLLVHSLTGLQHDKQCVVCVVAGAPMQWRLRRQALAAAAGDPAAAFDAAGSHGAFAGLRVVFYGSSDAPPFASLARMLKAGGGQLLRKAPPYTSCLPAPVAAGKGGRKGRTSAGTGAQGVANLAVMGTDKTTKDR